jgi:PmbA protein
LEEVLARATKVAEEAEVFSVSAEETQVHFEANRLKHLQSTQQTSLALRLIRDGKIGYAITTAVQDIQNLVDSALETARFGTAARFEMPAGDVCPMWSPFLWRKWFVWAKRWSSP